jgi:hypothetical protein
MRFKSVSAIALVAQFCICPNTHAALYSRLGGLAAYDSDLDITWLANTKLAASESFGLEYNVTLGYFDMGTVLVGSTEYPYIGESIIYSDGTMTWGGALEWIQSMNA